MRTGKATILAFVAASLLSAQAPAAAARKAVDLLLAANYTEFGKLLNANAKDKLTPDFLRDHFAAEVKDFGGVLDIGAPISLKAGDNDLVSFPVKFLKGTVNVQLTMDAAGKVAGLYLRPPEQPLPPVWKHASYSKADSFKERQVTVGSGDWQLGGTLTVPVGKGPFPGVVLVPGPGPNDRDESIFANRIFADIAEGLASRGIVVLRYDKRTKIYGPQMSTLAFTLKEELIEDADKAIALLRTQPEVDPKQIYALGHSLGGYALPRIAKLDGKLAGVIELAGNARRIEDISIAQTETMLAAKGGATPEEQKRLDMMKGEAAMVKSLAADKPHRDVLLGLPAEYFLDLKGYDAPAEAKRLGLPMLFLQGDRDFQVTMVDFGLWKSGMAGASKVTFHDYATLNHLFISGDGPSTPAEYRKPGNVAPAVIDDISGWIAKH
jgi:dienelactone hydrolase